MPSDRVSAFPHGAVGGTPGTRNPLPTGSDGDRADTQRICHSLLHGTRGTRGTRELADAGRDGGTAIPVLPPATPEQAADETADREAIADEEPLPRPGTPERERLDRLQSAMVAGAAGGIAARPPTTEPETVTR